LKYISDYEDVEKAVLGGAVLGGGGGGSIEEGLQPGKLAVNIGCIKIVSIEELPSEGKIVTASTVGSQIKRSQCSKAF